MKRRDLLLFCSTVTVSLAGCSTDTSGSDASVVETTDIDLGYSLSYPTWADGDTTGRIVVFTAEDGVRSDTPIDEYNRHNLPYSQEDIDEFITATDFDSSVIVFVETVGPNTSYSQVEFEDIHVDDGALRGNARAMSDDTELPDQAEVAVGVLLRVEFENDTIETAVFSVSDGWNETSDVESE